MTGLDTIRHFDVPRGCDRFHVEVEPDPEGDVEGYCFAMKDGNVMHDSGMVLTGAASTYRGKYYLELVPDERVEIAITVSYSDSGDWVRVLDRVDTVYNGDKLWFALRTGTSRYGIDR